MISGVSQANLHYEPNLEPKRHNPKLLQSQASQLNNEVKFNPQNSDLVAIVDQKPTIIGKAMGIDSQVSQDDTKKLMKILTDDAIFVNATAAPLLNSTDLSVSEFEAQWEKFKAQKEELAKAMGFKGELKDILTDQIYGMKRFLKTRRAGQGRV